MKKRKNNDWWRMSAVVAPALLATVAMAGGGPANDDCANAIAIGDGDLAYDTTGATTDGNAHADCQFDGQTYQDIWYLYTAGSDGTLTVSTCNQAGYDTDLVVYDAAGACPPGDGDLLGCNDDGDGCAGFSSEIVLDVSAGQELRIRVGGWNDGDQGPGTLTLSLEGGGGPCGEGAGDCCVDGGNGSPGCEDVECCETVCAIDPFCCNTTWDGLCASQALGLCEVCAEPPDSNDNCADAFVLTNNGTEYSNEGATDDGPSPCGVLGSDIWYTYTSDFDGTLTIDTFGSGYDTAIAAYSGCTCPADEANLVDCNDDSGGLQSQISFPVTVGQCYLIQVGGFAGSQGIGVINVTKGGDPCEGAEGDCCADNGTPGCEDPECCALICGQDPFCCESQWDGICAGAAQDQCEVCAGPPCEVICDDTEGEPCGDDVNGGCNGDPVAFGSVACGETVCGNAWAEGGTRDTDWYLISIPDDGTSVSAVLTSEFSGVCFIVDGIDGCAPVVVGDTGNSSNCTPGDTAAAVVNAGDYVVFVATGDFDGTPCGTANDYTVEVQADPCDDGGGEAAIDIKPGSCPNSWNPGSNGVIPVALIGSDSFDVSQVDISSLTISRADGVGGSVAPNMGPPGPSPHVEDAATAFDGEGCDCHEAEGDGIDDLVMHFRSSDVAEVLEMGDFSGGDFVELVVSGTLLDGTSFSGSDCVRLVPPDGEAALMMVNSNVAGAWVDTTQDLLGDAGGFASFVRYFPHGSDVTLRAPANAGHLDFVGWLVDGEFVGGHTIEVNPRGRMSVEAIYSGHGIGNGP